MQIKNLSFKRIEAGDFTDLDNMSREELYRVIRRFNADRVRTLKDTRWKNRGIRLLFDVHPNTRETWKKYCEQTRPFRRVER